MKIPLSNLDLSSIEVRYAEEAVRSGWISSNGQYLSRAELAWAAYCGSAFCTLVCNGTAALHLALMCMDLQPGDEVIVPGMTFVSPAAVVARMQGLPVFADVEDVSWCIDPEAIELLVTAKTRGVIAVDVLGHPADFDRLRTVCEKYNLFLIEDAAEAHGSRYKGRRTGSLGDISTFSFFANKTLGCGEGGAILTSDSALYEKAVMLKNHGMTKVRPYWHEYVGDNFRMTNVIAGILLGQIERANELTQKRAHVSKLYRKGLAGLSELELRPVAKWAEVVPWLEVLRVLPEAGITRDEMVCALRAEGIDARALWTPLVELPPYRQICEKRGIITPKAKELLGQLLWLPTASTMTDEQVQIVIDAVTKAVKQKKMTLS